MGLVIWAACSVDKKTQAIVDAPTTAAASIDGPGDAAEVDVDAAPLDASSEAAVIDAQSAA